MSNLLKNVCVHFQNVLLSWFSYSGLVNIKKDDEFFFSKKLFIEQ